jgi:hypothetical protein
LRPVIGAGKVARFIAAISSRPYMGIEISDMRLVFSSFMMMRLGAGEVLGPDGGVQRL